MDNTSKKQKNSFISVSAQICTLLLQFINRKVFVHFLDIEYLGYQTVFGNVFSLLSIAELGIGNIIVFQLYKEIASDNKQEIGKLLFLYKWMYRAVATIVLLAGFICYFILPYFIKDATASWDYLHLIYILQLSSIILGYFLSYKRTIYIATQQEYKCVQIDLLVGIIVQSLQILFLVLTKNYLIYLCLFLSTTIISNIIIAIKSNRDFPYLKQKYSITIDEVKRRNIFSDLFNLLVHKISYAIYGGTDNIIISAFCGVKQVALYGYYVVIQKGVMQILFYKLLNPVQATIGNIVYSNRKKEDLWNQFEVFDIFSFLIS